MASKLAANSFNLISFIHWLIGLLTSAINHSIHDWNSDWEWMQPFCFARQPLTIEVKANWTNPAQSICWFDWWFLWLIPISWIQFKSISIPTNQQLISGRIKFRISYVWISCSINHEFQLQLIERNSLRQNILPLKSTWIHD